MDVRAQQIAAVLRIEQLAAPAPVTAAFGTTTRAAVGIIIELNRQITELEAELATHFEAHPDADIYLCLPGLGVILGARVLGELGDDPNRHTTANFRENHAGTSSLTVTSGKKLAFLARHVRIRRLYDAVDQWDSPRALVLALVPSTTNGLSGSKRPGPAAGRASSAAAARPSNPNCACQFPGS